MKDAARDLLSSYVDALYPIIYINHFDFNVSDGLIRSIAGERKIVEFNYGLGAVDFESKAPLSGQDYDLVEFLKRVLDDGYDAPTFIVLKDIHNQLDHPEVVSLLKHIAHRNLHVEEYEATVFVVSSKLIVPAELEDLITIFDVTLPNIEEIREIIRNFKDDLKVEVDESIIDEIAISFKGLNEFQIRQILNLAYQNGGNLEAGDKQLILTQKEQLIKKAGLLEMIKVNEDINDIGGLDYLKSWLYKKAQIFNQLDKAIKFGVDVPKGILIVGMPGCGKSLTAKATSKLFNIPLVRLDVGRLLGKYVGESEENMRRALKLSEAISPCVLWIDEIEKAFSGVGGQSSDVTTRLFGQFLTWMQEKENTVFIVATANDISRIPPEFLRKGRFDELFFVDLPNPMERRKILEIHLKKRGRWSKELNLGKLARDTEGYNGADLEAIVREAIENCFVNECAKLTTEDLVKAKQNIKSISVTLKKRITQIKDAIQEMDLKDASQETDEQFKEQLESNARRGERRAKPKTGNQNNAGWVHPLKTLRKN